MRILILLVAVALGGCAARQAVTQYEETAQGYRACLLANPSAPQRCEGLRLAAEADADRVERYRRAFTPGQSHDVTIRNR